MHLQSILHVYDALSIRKLVTSIKLSLPLNLGEGCIFFYRNIYILTHKQ